MANLAYLLDPAFQIENNNGKPAVGGHIELFEAGTTNEYISYQNFDGTHNEFKIKLSTDGRATIIVDDNKTYDAYFYDSFNNLMFSRKNITPIVANDVSIEYIEHELDKKANADDVYSKNEIDDKLSNEFNTVYSSLDKKANADEVYTKSQTDTNISNKIEEASNIERQLFQNEINNERINRIKSVSYESQQREQTDDNLYNLINSKTVLTDGTTIIGDGVNVPLQAVEIHYIEGAGVRKELIANVWDGIHNNYESGEIVFYNGYLYRAKHYISITSSFLTADWEQVSISDVSKSLDAAKTTKIDENSEYRFAIVDNEERFIFGITVDGNIEWNFGIPKPIREVVIPLEQQVVELYNLTSGKVDKVEGKSLIDETVADSFHIVSNDEYIYALVDANEQLLMGVNVEGHLVCNFSKNESLINSQFANIVNVTFDKEFCFAITDDENKVLLGIRYDGSIEIDSNKITDSATNEFVSNLVNVEKTRAMNAEQALQNAINSISPTIVEGGENNPDEVFLTEYNDTITLKDVTKGLLGHNICYIRPNDNITDVLVKPNTTYIISFSMDLLGETIVIPENCLLKFEGGGFFNGTLQGNYTKIQGVNAIGDGINITGTWNIEKISSNILSNPYNENALKMLNALCNDNVENTVIIEPGEYIFTPINDSDILIVLTNNTKLVINGNISVTPNGFPRNYIIGGRNKHNIKICGSGTLKGDVDEHDYSAALSTHEWCHCIYTYQCNNVEICELTLKDATGDGISASGNNIFIHDMNISHCGRQGISMYNGNNYTITRCIFSDIFRTLPKAAIDIEPDWSGAYNVSISNIKMERCTGLQFLRTHCFSVDNVVGDNCSQLLYFRNSTQGNIQNVVYNGNTDSSMFIKADPPKSGENSCEDIVMSKVYVNTTANAVIDYSYITLNGLNRFSGNVIENNIPVAGSIKYENGRYKLSNGTNWVNFDGSPI